MKRRDFLQASSIFSANLIVGSSLLEIRNAEAETGVPIASLKAEIDPKKDLVLISGSGAPNKLDYNASFSKRKQITPQVRVVASSPQIARFLPAAVFPSASPAIRWVAALACWDALLGWPVTACCRWSSSIPRAIS